MWPQILISIVLSAISPQAHEGRGYLAEQRIAQLVEQTRIANKLPTLTSSERLTISGRRQSMIMAAKGDIFHQLPLHNYVVGWWHELGEDVGMGQSADDVFTMFMQSPEHRSLILDPTFRFMGTGVSIRNETIYVSLKFGSP